MRSRNTSLHENGYYPNKLNSNISHLDEFSNQGPKLQTNYYFQGQSNNNSQYERQNRGVPPINQTQKSYVQVLQQTLYLQTFSNIQNIIHQNTQMIERLSHKNQLLLKHMDNLKRIFRFKLEYYNNNNSNGNSRNRNLQLPTQNITQNPKQSVYNVQGQTVKTQNNHDIDIQMDQSSSIQTQKRQKVRKVKPYISKLIQTFNRPAKQPSTMSVQVPSQVIKKICLPYKGSVKYGQQSWIIEQNHVLSFLHTWMRKNIKSTPSESYNTIQKRLIIDLYMKWKQLQAFEVKGDLPQFKVQQIITNEMKAMFGCSCTLKQYIGLAFVNSGDSNDDMISANKIKGQMQISQTVNDQGQSEQFEGDKDKLQEEFSLEEYSDNQNN